MWEIRFKEIGSGSADLEQIRLLYERAFPSNERMPLSSLLTGAVPGAEMLGCYLAETDELIGMVSLYSYKDLTHILFMALREEYRSRGCGSLILKMLAERHAGSRLLADIEAETPEAANLDERVRRKAFYIHNGFRESIITYQWRGEGYVIMVRGGELQEQKYRAFWRHFYP